MTKLDRVNSMTAAMSPGAHDPSVCTLAILEWRDRASVALRVASHALLEADHLRTRVAELEAELADALDDADDPDPDDGSMAQVA